VTLPLDPLVKFQRELERLKIRNNELSSINKKLARRGGGFAIDETIEELRTFLAIEKQQPFVVGPKAYKKAALRAESPFKKGHYEYAAGMWSDWHVSEVVREEDANFVNDYNSMIASNRVWKMVDKSKRILTGHMSLYPIKKLWLLLLGDMINGTIHDEAKFTNDLSDQAAVVLCSRLIQLAIMEMKTLGIPIEIDCVVGNHPRTTAKMPTKRQAHQSMDWVVYEMVANYFHDDDQVKITIHTGQMGMREILGWRYIFEHGIDVKSGGEDAFEDRVRGLFDDGSYRQATGLTGTTFDMLCIGNMHKPKWLERVLVNGCLTGQNELGVSWRLKMIRAQQFLWGISENNVRTWQYPIDVTRVKSEKAENPFSEYTRWFLKKNGRFAA
jgi:hypothetical protein